MFGIRDRESNLKFRFFRADGYLFLKFLSLEIHLSRSVERPYFGLARAWGFWFILDIWLMRVCLRRREDEYRWLDASDFDDSLYEKCEETDEVCIFGGGKRCQWCPNGGQE